MAEYDLSGVNIPYNLDAEQSVLGTVLMDGEAMSELATILQPDHFYVAVNKAVYGVMLNMFITGERIDVVTVLEACMRQGIFETNEQAKEYLTRIMTAVPSISSVSKYAQIVVDKYMVRSLIFAAKEIIDNANEGAEDANTLIDFAEQKIFDIRSGAEIKGLTHISGIVLDRINALNDLYKQAKSGGGASITGLSTLYKELDKRIYGLNRSDLIILAARPGMGKTSFAMNIATNVGKKYQDTAIAVFSLEMSKEQIVSRMISSEASLTSEAMKTGVIPDEKWKDIGRAAEVLSRLNIYIDDTPGITVAGIKAKLRRMKNLGLVVIDYLQLMSSTKNYNGNRVVEISDITRNLKIMAKELNVPVITLSQLARGPEQRPDKRPLLSDLRESGSIEQDADIVMFLYRNAYYDKTDPNVNACECIVAKNRHGEPGTVPLGWDGEFTRFTNAEFVRQEN
ncbi:MAG TPA: replicative DNA helicase [Ruminococcaceae bacterium]|jgi:replicative DNA helicase|nr:replicative DNA helicase [Oscillospiraceae bacterium]HBJ24417.1 replicative DNA helicase [Oscillospiraceae bacterium]